MALLRQHTPRFTKKDSLLEEEISALNPFFSILRESGDVRVKRAVEVDPCLVKIDSTKKRCRHDDDRSLSQGQRRKGSNSLEIITSFPDNDGYQWRKYGEKNILNKHFTRCYYKCTYYKEYNCKATKQVQRQDYSDPPIYNVTYFHDHICPSSSISWPDSNSNSQSTISQKILDFSTNTSPMPCYDTHTDDIREEKREKSPARSTSTAKESSNSTKEVHQPIDRIKRLSDGSAAPVQSKIEIAEKEFSTFEVPSDEWCDLYEFDSMLSTLEDSQFIKSLLETDYPNYFSLRTHPDWLPAGLGI